MYMSLLTLNILKLKASTSCFAPWETAIYAILVSLQCTVVDSKASLSFFFLFFLLFSDCSSTKCILSPVTNNLPLPYTTTSETSKLLGKNEGKAEFRYEASKSWLNTCNTLEAKSPKTQTVRSSVHFSRRLQIP